MENKKKKEKKVSEKGFLFLSLIIISYFFYGFYVNENSAGAGGYKGDFVHIWKNLLLLSEGIFANLNHPDYSDSRPPLSYILHILFNPFTDNVEAFRISTFAISLLVPVLLFFSIKEKFKKLNNGTIILISSVVTLSPYFRTTAYWSLGENYAIIFLLLSYLIFSKLKKNLKIYDKNKLYYIIFILCFISSLIVYFDQKLVFIPLVILCFIAKLEIEKKYKFFALITFFIFSLPYFYLMFLWKGLIPSNANIAREVGSKISIFNLGYCMTIIVVTIFPFVFTKNLKLKSFFRYIVINKNNLVFLISFFIVYIIFCIVIGNFENLSVQGKGVFHKISNLLINDNSLRLFFTILAFCLSLVFLLIIFESKMDILMVSFILFSSLLIYPFYQEYLDPLMYILMFSFFTSNIKIDRKKFIYFMVLYYSVFSLGSKYYYSLII